MALRIKRHRIVKLSVKTGYQLKLYAKQVMNGVTQVRIYHTAVTLIHKKPNIMTRIIKISIKISRDLGMSEKA